MKVVDRTPIEVTARLDAATDYSILNAVDIKYFQRDADTWVRFTIDSGSVVAGKRVTLERPVLKDIKQHQPDGAFEHQPQVALEFCLGVQDFKTEVRLQERSGYTAPLLLGHADLARLGSVDAQRQFTQEPRCVPAQPPTVLPPNPINTPASTSAASDGPAFHCDGRTRCPQMHSCVEAKFFLKNCPNVKMDGDGDGIPCEEQWCTK